MAMLMWKGDPYPDKELWSTNSGWEEENEPLPGMSPIIDHVIQNGEHWNHIYKNKNIVSRLYLYAYSCV